MMPRATIYSMIAGLGTGQWNGNGDSSYYKVYNMLHTYNTGYEYYRLWSSDDPGDSCHAYGVKFDSTSYASNKGERNSRAYYRYAICK